MRVGGLCAVGPAPRREIVALVALTLLPLLPFLPRAISIDAPVFVAVAQQIIAAPADPFGFQMIWDPTSPIAAEFNRNPPLLSYWLAAWIRLLGEHDALLHAVMLPFPLLAALSFYGIARRVAGSGLAPTALLVATPAFLVLATTLLLDVPVLAWWLFAVYALLRAAERPDGHAGWETAAGLAAAAAGLTKYVGFSAAPLLAAGLVLLGPRGWAAGLRIVGTPLAIWTLWGLYTARLYGSVHFLGSTDVVIGRSLAPEEFWNQVLSTPIFYGAALLFPILLWGRALLRGTRGGELAVAGILLGTATVTFVLPEGEPSRRHPLETEEAIFGAVGFAAALFSWGLCLRPRRWRAGPVDLFLAIWLTGLLVFSMFLNWHVNAADALLAAPPLLLLVFRIPELRPAGRSWLVWLGVLLPLAGLLAWADAIQANVYRTAARRMAAHIDERDGARWFVGHWGFQHYLERNGFQAVVPPMYGRSDLALGDWVASARNVSQLDVSQNMKRYQLREAWAWSERSWLPLRTTNADAGAGFYSHHSGYVPFAWTDRPVESLGLGRVVRVASP